MLRMNSVYACLDESGSLASPGTYLVIAVLLTDSPQRLKRVIKHARERAGKKKSELPELKFYLANNALRRRVLGLLAKESLEIYVLAIKKTQPIQDTPRNYARAIWAILSECLVWHPDLRLVIDLRYSAPRQRHEVNRWLEKWAGRPLTITHANSQSNEALQAADFIVGALYQRYTKGNTAFSDFIIDKVVVEKIIR